MNEELLHDVRRHRAKCPDVPWHRFIPAILFRLHNTVNASTGFTAYGLMGIHTPELLGGTPEHDFKIFHFGNNYDASVTPVDATPSASTSSSHGKRH